MDTELAMIIFCMSIAFANTETPDQLEPNCPDEQVCTRFAYEYKLMQKLIRLEMRELELEKRIMNLESSKIGAPSTELVQFNARLSRTKTVRVGDRLIFDTVISNIGGAYNSANGYFTATVDGIYLFTVTICGNNKDELALSVYHEKDRIGEVRVGDPEWKDCSSDTSTTYMTSESRVFVKMTYPSANTRRISDQHWNTFTGVLIQKA